MNKLAHFQVTVLHATTTIAQVEQACKYALQNLFAQICIPPLYIKKCRELLQGSHVKVTTAIGFPYGYAAIEAKLAETLLAIVDGADELDVVVNLLAIKNNDWQYVANELNHLLPLIKGKEKKLNIIIEVEALTPDEVSKCVQLYTAAGVDAIQVSTSFKSLTENLALIERVRSNLTHQIPIKVMMSTGNKADAAKLFEAGAIQIGCSPFTGQHLQ